MNSSPAPKPTAPKNKFVTVSAKSETLSATPKPAGEKPKFVRKPHLTQRPFRNERLNEFKKHLER